jgi:hypothetical protein
MKPINGISSSNGAGAAVCLVTSIVGVGGPDDIRWFARPRSCGGDVMLLMLDVRTLHVLGMLHMRLLHRAHVSVRTRDGLLMIHPGLAPLELACSAVVRLPVATPCLTRAC